MVYNFMYKSKVCLYGRKWIKSAILAAQKWGKEGSGVIKNKKKGITLSEICIVLAVLSIVSLAIVSYAAMATGRGISGADKLKVMQDIELLEAMVDNWFNEAYTGPDSLTVGENKLSVGDKELHYQGGTLYTKFSDTDLRSYHLETVESLRFEVVKSKDDEIFFCTVTYVYRLGQSKEVEETYTFCINPRVGESIS